MVGCYYFLVVVLVCLFFCCLLVVLVCDLLVGCFDFCLNLFGLYVGVVDGKGGTAPPNYMVCQYPSCYVPVASVSTDCIVQVAHLCPMTSRI